MTEPHGRSDEPPGGADWIVDEHGQARRPNGKSQGELESYSVPEFLDDNPVSQANEYIHKTKKLAKDLTNGSQELP